MTSHEVRKLQQSMSIEESVLFQSEIMGKTQKRKSVKKKQREDGKDGQEPSTSKGKAPLSKSKDVAFKYRQVKAKQDELRQAV